MRNDLIVSADLFPTLSNEKLFVEGNINELFGNELLKVINNSNARVFNLEGPFINNGNPIKKSGPNLKAKEEAFNAIKKLNPTVLSLGNNHILDQGEIGVISTIKLCEENNILISGISNFPKGNIEYAVLNISGYKIAIYSCAENEFSTASNNKIGAKSYDPLIVFDEVKELKKQNDYVIVLYHGGREEYRYPTPQIRRVFHKFADAGADVIINQHSHCIGCFEKKGNSTLIYGQGNFLFDDDNNEFWKTGLLIKIIFDSKISVEYIPVVKKNNKVRIAEGDEKNKILDDFFKRSNDILKEEFIEEKYSEYVNKFIGAYLVTLHGRNFFWRVFNKITRGKVWKIIYGGNKKYSLLNAIRCESHYELLKFGLEKIL